MAGRAATAGTGAGTMTDRLFPAPPRIAAAAAKHTAAKQAAVLEQDRVRWLRQIRTEPLPEPNGHWRWSVAAVLPRGWADGWRHWRWGYVLPRADIPVWAAECLLCGNIVGVQWLVHGFFPGRPDDHYHSWRFWGEHGGSSFQGWDEHHNDGPRAVAAHEQAATAMFRNGGHTWLRCPPFTELLELLTRFL